MIIMIINHFIIIHPSILFRLGGAEAYPSCLRAKGRVDHGQVGSLTQGLIIITWFISAKCKCRSCSHDGWYKLYISTRQS